MDNVKKFFKPVDKRSVNAMLGYLTNHFRYHTAGSWNKSTSYANNLKIYKLGLSHETAKRLYDLLDVQEFHDEIRLLIQEWEHKHDYLWQAGFNGRNGGYLVLYQGKREPSGYKSYCTKCGQLNFATTEKNNQCGVCRNHSRVDFKGTHMRVVAHPGRGTDHDGDFSWWTADALRARVGLVQGFDKLCDAIVEWAIEFARSHTVVEKEICVPRKIKVLQEVG